MDQKKINYIFAAVVIALSLVLGFFGVTLPVVPDMPAPLLPAEDVAIDGAQSFGVYQTDCRMEQGGNQWTAADGCVWQVQSGATLDIQSGSTLTLTSPTLTGAYSLGFTDYSITNGTTITPAYTVYALDSSVAATITLAASAAEGQLLILIGDDANTITIADTNVRTSTGNAVTLGQYDTAMWIYQDSEWLELALLANQ